MIKEVIDINNKTSCTRLLSLGNPNVEVPKQAIKQANNDERNVYYLLLSNFPKLTSTFNATLPPKHSVGHHICTDDPPIYSTQRRFSPEILKQVRTQFNSIQCYKLASFHLQIQSGRVHCMWLKNQRGFISLVVIIK